MELRMEDPLISIWAYGVKPTDREEVSVEELGGEP